MAFELSTLNGANGLTLLGEVSGDWSGFSVSGGGDLNGDGISDVIVSARNAAPHGASSGATYVIFGSSTGFSSALDLTALNGTNGFQLSGEANGDQSGYDVASAGDINGDGVDDLVIGAPGVDDSASGGGGAYVLFGKTSAFGATVELSSLNGSNGFLIVGAAAGDHLGVSASSAGDVNGDGVGDLIVGAKEADGPAGADSGQTYILFGSTAGFSSSINVSTLDGSNGFVVNGAAAGDFSGVSAAGGGDFNGDGISDFIIGAYGAGGTGEAYVVFGKSTGFNAGLDVTSLDGSNGFQIKGAAAGDVAGYSVAAAGDVNGDGIDDVIVGAIGADPNGVGGAGAGHVIFGKSSGFDSVVTLASLDGGNGFAVSGGGMNDETGISVSAAGDVNGDGFADLLVGAFFANSSAGSDSGETYLIFGGSNAFAAAINVSALPRYYGLSLNGVSAGDQSGVAVSTAGDVNDDGLDDIIIGALRGDPLARTDAGETYIVFGATNLGATNGTGGAETLTGGSDDDFLVALGGADSLDGAGGADLLKGGSGADSLDGGTGVDAADYSDSGSGVTVSLSAGTGGGGTAQGDTLSNLEGIVGSGFGDTLTGANSVNNELRGGAGNDDLDGLSGNDTLYGDGGADQLVGGGGADSLNGGAGADSLDGGSGTDTASYTSALSGVAVDLSTGTGSGDVAQGDSLTAIENLVGSNHADTLTGADAVANQLSGGGARDSLLGLSGTDTLLGGDGNDILRGGSGSDSLDGGEGLDIAAYTGSSAAVSVDLGTGAVSGGDAAGDTIAGFEGANGSSFNDTLTGDGGANVLGASGGADSLSGLAGADTLTGGSGNDTLLGGTNSDSLTGGAGADSIVGGGGVDKVSYTNATAAVALNLAAGMGTAGDALGDVISDVDIVSGSNFNDTVTGSSGADDLRGRGGSDLLSGGAGNDKLDGSNGNDTLIGGAGNDTMTGGGHKDRFEFSGSFGADVINLFNAGTGVADVIRLIGFGPAFDSFGEVLAATTDAGSDCVIDLGAGRTITLVGVNKAGLNADDFSFG